MVQAASCYDDGASDLYHVCKSPRDVMQLFLFNVICWNDVGASGGTWRGGGAQHLTLAVKSSRTSG